MVRLQSTGLVAGLAVSFVISAAPIPSNAREIVQFTSYPAGTAMRPRRNVRTHSKSPKRSWRKSIRDLSAGRQL